MMLRLPGQRTLNMLSKKADRDAALRAACATGQGASIAACCIMPARGAGRMVRPIMPSSKSLVQHHDGAIRARQCRRRSN
jgi:hypothetical protein